ncbi:unnamed protein product [Caenorhabditis angaria]|uniref:Uncharacterized protein n=1 Tax=Caenorhabditis angaria TaxID=860376 RepID=A0A9P1I447_9PELO|nr:unnamed protein product [Caenorhabditis angaria]
MERVIQLLFLIAALPTTSAILVVLYDSSKCVHLQCEWRVEGKLCKSGNLLYRLNQKKNVPNSHPLNYPYVPRGDNESATSILARVRATYPVNTFTVIGDDVAIGEDCKGRNLYCNSSHFYVTDSYESFLKNIQKQAVPPKFQC